MSQYMQPQLAPKGQEPPIRRRRQPPVRRYVTTERPRPPRRNGLLPLLVVLFLACVGYAWFSGSLQRMAKLDPETLVADAPSPSEETPQDPIADPAAELRPALRQAIESRDYVSAKGIAAEIIATGSDLGNDSNALKELEESYREELITTFKQAETEKKMAGMTQAKTTLTELWPEDPVLAELDKSVANLQQEQQNQKETAQLLSTFDQQVSGRRYYEATKTLNKIAQLGHSVSSERARFIKTIRLPGDVSIRFRYIPGGTFTMGSPGSEAQREDDEVPHKVTISKGFWMSETEVTQAQFEAIMEFNNSDPKGDRLPVNNVLLAEALSMARRINIETSAKGVRLPTEAEWEYACRADSTTPFHTGKELPASRANYDGNYPYEGGKKGEYRRAPIKVRSFAPNAWGLYDMHGNVWEWCDDKYDAYPEQPAVDPRNTSYIIKQWVVRGGGWGDYASICRSANRHYFSQNVRLNSLGFRLVMDP